MNLRTRWPVLPLVAVPASGPLTGCGSEDELAELVRGAFAGRRAVLILDDAVDAEQADPLIPDEPGTLVIGVAGGPLTGIPDVRPCTLGGLDPK
ncbi:hypothetical protein ACFT8Q_30585, partial [Streptomyces griseoincarnatus]